MYNFVMAESKLSSIQKGNVCEITHDRINRCHTLIPFFVIMKLQSVIKRRSLRLNVSLSILLNKF